MTTTTQPKRVNTVMTSMFGRLEDWTLFERVWLITFTAINIMLVFIMDNTVLSAVASISGMLCVVLVAKGKISNYLFGLIQVLIYGWIAFEYKLYGEVALNWVFYVPVQFIGFYLWRKHTVSRGDSETGEDIDVKSLGVKNTLIYGTVAGVLIVMVAFALKYIGGYSVGLDSATTVLSVGAQLLMLARYREQWIMWIIINILSIIMWVTTLMSQGGNDWSTVVMWSAFLCNSIYGYINWSRMISRNGVEVSSHE